jgi:hypothetical protein
MTIFPAAIGAALLNEPRTDRPEEIAVYQWIKIQVSFAMCKQ